MDDKVLASQKKKLEALTREISSLTLKERTTRAKLDDEHSIIAKAKAERAVLVDRLIGASAETAAQTHTKIDGLDRTITASARLAESYERLLTATNTELAAVMAEQNRVNVIVGQEETARAFTQWQVELQQARADAEQAFADARLKLAALDALCARGGERFHGSAANIAAATFEDLLIRQANLESNGWKLSVPVYRADAIIHIRPLVPR